jgi:hypothetical protein
MIHQPEQQPIERERRFAPTGAMRAPDASELRTVEASGEELAKGVGVCRSVGRTTTAPAFERMRFSHPEAESDLMLFRNKKVK